MRALASLITAVAVAALAAGCATSRAGGAATRTAWGSPAAPPAEELILVTFGREAPPPASRTGSTPRTYAGRDAYRETGWEARKRRQLARRHDLEAVDEWPIEALGVQCVVYRVADGRSLEAVMAAVASERWVEGVQPMGGYELEAGPPGRPSPEPAPEVAGEGLRNSAYDDPYLPLQSGLQELGLPWAHRWATGAGVTVGVVDTAVDASHPDLAGRVGQLDFVGGPAAGANEEDHGTAVVGIIAAAANNGRGIVGVAPAARIQAIRACWPGGPGPACNTFTLARALAAVLSEPPSRRPAVLNLSLSGAPDPLIERLLRRVVAEGIAVVAAVGPSPERSFPASLPEVIAADRDDRPGAGVRGAVRAPAADVLTTVPTDEWAFRSGTSLAAAHVTGAVALVLELAPGLSPREVRELLRSSGSGPAGDHLDACVTLAALRPAVACLAGPSPDPRGLGADPTP